MKKTLLILSLIFLISCSKDSNIPKGVLSKKEFIEIVADIQKSQSLANIKADTSIEIRNIRLENYNIDILKKYNVSKERYNKSVEYYSTKPEELNKLMDEVVKKLNKDAS